MKKKTIFIITLVFLLVLVGCSSKNQENLSSTEENIINNYPITITDQVGRVVTIEEEPDVIISGYYISTSLLIALEQDEKLVGIENDGDKRPVYEKSAPKLLELPGMGTVKDFDLERCALLEPDLVILPYKLKDIATSLEQLNIPVIFVKPETQQLLMEMIDLLGEVTNSQEKAKDLKYFIETKMDEMIKSIENKEKPRVYLSGNSSFLSTAGPNMYQHSLIENAGGENVAQEITDTYWAEISYEQLLAWNPEYIILAADASYSVESVLSDVNLTECDAIKNNNVYRIPNNIESWDSPIPASILGNLWLASTLHKDSYTVNHYKEAVTQFYETFYGFIPEK